MVIILVTRSQKFTAHPISLRSEHSIEVVTVTTLRNISFLL
jgi:hypothetical protein